MFFVGRELIDVNRKENIARHSKNRKHNEKMARINSFIVQSVASKDSKQLQLQEKVEELARLRHDLVNGLIEYIFPVEEVKGKKYIYLIYYLIIWIEYFRNQN